jgi:hypothetical protein
VSTALVPVVLAERRASCSTNSRPSAGFLAQLIAVAEQAPQTRPRRRIAPHEAVAAYRALGQPAASSGRALSRSL